MKVAVLAMLALVALASNVEARPRRAIVAHPDCNIVFPCEGVGPSARGAYIARKVGIGGAQNVYRLRGSAGKVARAPRQSGAGLAPEPLQRVASVVVSHPRGCPSRAFCGCGAAVRIFGSPIRSLWLAANWFRFPRAAPAAGMVAVRRHHVFVLERHLGGNTWLAYDANSGRRLTRIHARSIAGYVIVNPRGGAA